MKKLAPFLFGILFVFFETYAQNVVIAPDWVGFVYKYGPIEDILKFVGDPVDITLILKDENGDTVYIEHFIKTVQEGGYVNAYFGQGTVDPNSPTDNYFDGFNTSLKICSSVVVHDATGDYAVMGESTLSSGAESLYAREANNSKALGGIPYSVERVGANAVLSSTSKYDIPIVEKTGSLPNEVKKFVNTGLSDFVNLGQAPSSLNGNIIAYVNLGTGTPFPIALTRNQLSALRSYFTICPFDMDDLEYGVEVKMPETVRNLVHATAAIYAENIKSESAVGLFANATARGVYSQGQTGALSITNGTGNGAATWSRVGSAPAAGGFKYGIFAEDQGLAGSWAAGIFGNGFYTGTWSQSSDARLKIEIRSQTNALDKVLQIRPAQYRYVESTPYNLPKGIHYGFIAQEMEGVLPELVSDVTMPKDLYPNNMVNSGTETYKAINYIEMISILTAAIQELNTKVDAQNDELVRLRKELQVYTKSK